MGVTAVAPRQAGWLRVALNMNNPALVRKSGDTCTGLAIDIAERIGDAMGVTLEFADQPNARAVVEAASDAWDIAFLAIDPSRMDRIAFSQPYLSVEATFLVRDDVPARSCQNVLRGDQGILSARGAAYHARLASLKPSGSLIVAESPAEAQERFRRGEGAALAGIRETLENTSVPGCHLLPDCFAKIEQAVAIPAGAGNQPQRINPVLLDFLRGQ